MQRKIRVLVAKPGLDGHDRGAKVVAAALRDAGMEVIYTGLHQSCEQVVEAAVQEDVDVVALSILSGAHMTLFPEVLGLMRERGIADRLLTGGGIIPAEDMERLSGMGVGKLFGPGSSTRDIATYIRAWFADKFGADALPPAPPPPPARPMVPPVEHAVMKPKAAKPAAAPKKSAKPARAKTAKRGAKKSAKPARRKAAKRGAKKPAKPARAKAAKRGAKKSAKPARRKVAKRAKRKSAKARPKRAPRRRRPARKR